MFAFSPGAKPKAMINAAYAVAILHAHAERHAAMATGNQDWLRICQSLASKLQLRGKSVWAGGWFIEHPCKVHRSFAWVACRCPAAKQPDVNQTMVLLRKHFGRPSMTISALASIGGNAASALSLLSSAGSAAAASSASKPADTTSVATAPDGTVTTTVTSATGDVISVTVTKPATPQNQAANPNALLDVKA
jgi:hypothetical protein